MKNLFLTAVSGVLVLITLTSCEKAVDLLTGNENITPGVYKEYTIRKGEHFSQQSSYTPTEFSELNFTVKFDNSAAYQSASANNQYDINKLYGFADNSGQHHEFSARIGWRWSDGALRLFGYIYNDGLMSFEEIAVIDIGSEHECSIKVFEKNYLFTVNGKTISMPRASSGNTANGYKLFPYFGGDETAPHDIHIWIKEK